MPDTPVIKLLLVDDDHDLRETLGLILEHGGFEVVAAANVNEALKLIVSDTFDVLVSDLHMPSGGRWSDRGERHEELKPEGDHDHLQRLS